MIDTQGAHGLVARFDRLSTRERVLAVAATIVVLVAALNGLLLGKLDARRKSLAQELATLQSSMTTAANEVEAMGASDATSAALTQRESLQHELEGVNTQLASAAAGMIAPERMADVIHAMLARQHGVALVSLRNLPAVRVVQDKSTIADRSGPYVHPVEIVLDGSYLDVLAYLQTLERLPWHFYWRVLDLKSAEYPVNRVRVELGTVSMDREWIGL